MHCHAVCISSPRVLRPTCSCDSGTAATAVGVVCWVFMSKALASLAASWCLTCTACALRTVVLQLKLSSGTEKGSM